MCTVVIGRRGTRRIIPLGKAFLKLHESITGLRAHGFRQITKCRWIGQIQLLESSNQQSERQGLTEDSLCYHNRPKSTEILEKIERRPSTPRREAKSRDLPGYCIKSLYERPANVFKYIRYWKLLISPRSHRCVTERSPINVPMKLVLKQSIPVHCRSTNDGFRAWKSKEKKKKKKKRRC